MSANQGVAKHHVVTCPDCGSQTVIEQQGAGFITLDDGPPHCWPGGAALAIRCACGGLLTWDLTGQYAGWAHQLAADLHRASNNLKVSKSR